MKELKYLNKYLYKYKGMLLSGVLFVVLANIFAIVPAQMVRHALNLVIDSIDTYNIFDGSSLQEAFRSDFYQTVFFYGLLIVAMALMRGVFLFFMRQTVIVMSRKIEYDMKNDLFQHYQSLPLSFYRRNNTGDLMARISEDVGKVRMYLGPAMMYGMNLTVSCILVIGYMLSVNVNLTLWALLPLPLLSISIYYVNNLINKRSEDIQESLSNMSTFVQEAFSGIRVIKAFIRESDNARMFDDAANDYKDKQLKLSKVNALFYPLMLSLIGLSTILTVYVGGIEVAKGSITAGNIAEFIMYVNLLTWPVTSLGWVTSIVQRAAASQKRINQFLQTENDIVSTEQLKHPVQGSIQFDSVSLVYPDSGIKAVRKVSFEVGAGETLALLGTTGAGKSTIANLVCRMYDPTDGKVLIDGKDIKSYDIAHIRNQIGYVPQDVFLFSDTVKNNIAFGKNDASEEEIIQAAKDADLWENIKRFDKGLSTMVGERGITLSGGQKQRTSIARALIRKPKILILDDSLSAVDTNTENAILNNLKGIMKDRTSIIISHRVSSAKLADKIIFLNDGEVVEMGSHEELMKANGFYKDLYEKQIKSDVETSEE
ncbi:ABC transporter ATP-binding protein [Algivirga pacifica]|uniref:ABC transporter ATP-binding protein n=1 Tax=Algivirga pacifica TaxID=1162670 RepID=A0ABP9D955_9BACT